mgnify:CR=1 FL=1
MKKTVAFCTLGCKVNQYETDAMRGSFEAEGIFTGGIRLRDQYLYSNKYGGS